MTRWLIRLAFPALAVLLALLAHGVKAPDDTTGQPSELPQNNSLPSFEAMVPVPIVTEGPDIVFKWQDDDGSWHYADQPPAQGPWYTLAIEPGGEAQPQSQTRSGSEEGDLNSPYTAPFTLGPGFPEAGG